MEMRKMAEERSQKFFEAYKFMKNFITRKSIKVKTIFDDKPALLSNRLMRKRPKQQNLKIIMNNSIKDSSVANLNKDFSLFLEYSPIEKKKRANKDELQSTTMNNKMVGTYKGNFSGLNFSSKIESLSEEKEEELELKIAKIQRDIKEININQKVFVK